MELSEAEERGIRERCERATAGPWKTFIRPKLVSVMAAGTELVHWMGFDGVEMPWKQRRANAIFIAHARQDLPALLRALDAVREERDEAITECRKRKGIEQDVAHWRERAEAAEAALVAEKEISTARKQIEINLLSMCGEREYTIAALRTENARLTARVGEVGAELRAFRKVEIACGVAIEDREAWPIAFSAEHCAGYVEALKAELRSIAERLVGTTYPVPTGEPPLEVQLRWYFAELGETQAVLAALRTRLARFRALVHGCHDYGGGYSGREYKIYHHGIQTVVNVIEAALKDNGTDTQLRAVERIGQAALAPAQGEPK